MSAVNPENIDQRIVDFVGEAGILIKEDSPGENRDNKVYLTYEDEGIFAKAMGNFIKEHKKLELQISHGLVKPSEAVAREAKLLSIYKKEMKGLSKPKSV